MEWLQLNSHQANAELAALRQDLEEALQNVDAARKERDVARDLAASFVKDDKAIAAESQQVAWDILKHQLAISQWSSPPPNCVMPM